MALFGWSNLQVSMAFATMLFFLGIGAVLGGHLQDRFGPRQVSIVGIAMWGAGNVLTGLGVAKFGLPWLYLCYGLISGIGAGIAYLTPGATAIKWFPEERGLANGIVLLGFGVGSIVFNGIVTALPAFTSIANRANAFVVTRQAVGATGPSTLVDPAGMQAVTSVFLWSGVIFIVVGVTCALVLHSPSRTYAVPKAAQKLAHEIDFRPREMLRTPSFYFLWTIFFVDAFAGLSLLGNAVPVYCELTGATATAAAIVYGVPFGFSTGSDACSGRGSPISSGRRALVAFIFGAQGVAFIVLVHMHSQLGVGLAFAAILLTFSGVFGIMPALLADYFGTAYLGENYGWIISAASSAGLAGPVLVGLLEDVTGSLTGAYVPVAIVLIASIALPLIARRPANPSLQRTSPAT